MDFLRPGFFEHADQVFHRRTAHDRVIDEDNAFSPDSRFQNIKLDTDAIFAFFLGRFDEGSADIAIFMENNLIWNTGCLRISHRGGQAGIRYTGDEVGIGREGMCESRAAAQPCLIDAHIIDVAVEAGKIDVFENAVRPFFLLQAFIRKNAVAGDGHDLTRFDITDKFAADRGDGTAFRCHDPDISLFAEAERTQTKWVTNTDQLARAGDNQGISATCFCRGPFDCLFSGRGSQTFSGDVERDYL